MKKINVFNFPLKSSVVIHQIMFVNNSLNSWVNLFCVLHNFTVYVSNMVSLRDKFKDIIILRRVQADRSVRHFESETSYMTY